MSVIRKFAGFTLTTLALAALGLVAACTTAPETKAERVALTSDSTAFLTRAKAADPSLDKFFDSCVGYAVLPEIGKGGFIFGGAYGRGQLYDRDGRLVGYCDVTQGSVGAQLGGQSFGEIIFFETNEALNRFKGDKFVLAAQASAVALGAGAAAAAKYEDGVAIFLMNPKGLMLEASIGGQQFGYQALADAESLGS
ncbi:MAG: hypothetical protein RL136_1081 [Planctomycetota bacterium]|jgi:lipid-binding SYLF domain-containing protein